jgi:hypothetical protein
MGMEDAAAGVVGMAEARAVTPAAKAARAATGHLAVADREAVVDRGVGGGSRRLSSTASIARPRP